MLVIGLTGGIATGKSTVAGRLRDLGAPILDADRISREVVEPGEPALEQIRRRFGDGVIAPGGELDRKALGRIVFIDAHARRDLEAIIHPLVRRRMREELLRLRESGEVPVVVCDIPLLYETEEGLQMVDRVLVVYASKDEQRERLMRRDGLTSEEAQSRIEAQMPTEEKAARADYVVDNSGEMEETLRQVNRLWEEWTR